MSSPYLDEIANLRGVGFQNPVDFSQRAMYLPNMPPDSFQLMNGRQKKSFSIFRAAINFLKGGVVDTIKGMFTLKGIAMMAGAGALIAFTGGAALPYLAALGIGMGGFQFTAGAINAAQKYSYGDVEGAEKEFQGMGSGFTTALLSFIGLRKAYTSGTVKTANVNEAGQVTSTSQQAAKEGIMGTFKQMFRDVTGKSRMVYKDQVTQQNLFQGGKELFLDNIRGFRLKLANKFGDPNKVLESTKQARDEAMLAYETAKAEGKLNPAQLERLQFRSEQAAARYKAQSRYVAELQSRTQISGQYDAKIASLREEYAKAADPAQKQAIQERIRALESEKLYTLATKEEQAAMLYRQQQKTLVEKQVELAKKPGDPALKGAVDTAKTQQEALLEKAVSDFLGTRFKSLADYAKLQSKDLARLPYELRMDMLKSLSSKIDNAIKTLDPKIESHLAQIAELQKALARVNALQGMFGRGRVWAGNKYQSGELPIYLAASNQTTRGGANGYDEYAY